MSTKTVLVERIDQVLLIKLNRPEARNAIDGAMAKAIADAVDLLDSDPSLAVGILASTSPTFSAGMDLKAFLAGESPIVPGRGLAGITSRAPAKPLIAAVDGAAVAGGFELVLACDLVVASVSASFGLPEVKRGLIAGAGGVINLPRRLPPSIAMQVILTGDPLSAERAYELGLVNDLVTARPLACAVSLAQRIARNAPLAVQGSKEVALASQDWLASEKEEKQREIITPVFQSQDAREGALAFAEKRAPRWHGK
ncbi:MAG: crotonase/enoyl-CoA hydratase family protein [Pseudomonadota bacterium]